MFRAGLLLIIRRYYSVYTAVGIHVYHAFMLTGCWQDRGGTHLMDFCMLPPRILAQLPLVKSVVKRLE